MKLKKPAWNKWNKWYTMCLICVLLLCGMFYLRPQALEEVLAEQLPNGSVTEITCLDWRNMWLDSKEYIITEPDGIAAFMEYFNGIRMCRDIYYSYSNGAVYSGITGQQYRVVINGEGTVILQTYVGLNGQRYIKLGPDRVYRVLSWQGFAEIGYLAREHGELASQPI